MPTGSFSITSVQPAASTPSSTSASVSTDASGGFSALYQNTLNDAPSAQKETATAPAPAAREEESSKALTQASADNTATQKHASAPHRDKHATSTEADTSMAQSSRRRTSPSTEAANDILASMVVEQMMASNATSVTQNVPSSGTAAPKKGLDPVNSTAPTITAQATQTKDGRDAALQQALALQQLVDPKRGDQAGVAGNVDALKAAAQSASTQEGAQLERRTAVPFSIDSTAPSERSARARATPITTSQNTASAQNLTAQMAARLADDDGDVDASSSRSQADFGLQNALSHASNSSSGAQAANAATPLPAIDSDHWNQALASHISTMSRLDQGQTTLTLAPASLGSLEVSLQMDRGQADIQFVTHSRQAHDALTSSVNALHHALADQGIQLQNVSVVEHRPDAGQQTSQQQHAFSSMASDQQSSQQSSYQAHEQGSAPETVARSTHEDAVDATPVSSTSTSNAHGLRAMA